MSERHLAQDGDRSFQRRDVSIVALPFSPAELYEAPQPTWHWLFTSRFRVWPAGYYCDGVELDATNEAQARMFGAIELGVSGEKCRVQKVARASLEGSARA